MIKTNKKEWGDLIDKNIKTLKKIDKPQAHKDVHQRDTEDRGEAIRHAMKKSIDCTRVWLV